ncbi:SigE family RNA polymerase sigma factor [Tessaracoccus rhinocerotis]|uniref:SigE family RNA polymerase sigma factor n=1 Tax=Tessaracoccus rhinocerotis TaxID=1689449 RepID=UPI00163D5FED|nr:SigE family RNA polymerase sigma factor [Tessaracoccus rhinocerotis]
MAGIAEDSAAAFDRYVDERGGELWWAAWLLTGDEQHAEDLVQTALSKTWTRYSTFDNDRHFEAYVRTTIYRTYVSWWRRLNWRKEVPAEIHPDAFTVDDDGHAQRADLLRALAKLPRLQRAVLMLRYFEDRTTRQVSEELGIPMGTVASHARRGLAALRTSAHLADEEEPE